MNYAFQDRENLFLAMDLMAGGDLRFHINRVRIFSEEQSSKYDFLFMFLSFSRVLRGLCVNWTGIPAFQWNIA